MPQIQGARLQFMELGLGVKIYYFYGASDGYPKAKEAYKNYFAQVGWRISNETNETWGPSSILFENDQFNVKIEQSLNGDGHGYSIACSNR